MRRGKKIGGIFQHPESLNASCLYWDGNGINTPVGPFFTIWLYPAEYGNI